MVNLTATHSNRRARTLGRRKKVAAQSFGVRTEPSGIPLQKVSQLLRMFADACNENDASEADAFFLLQDFTDKPRRSEVMSGMQNRHGGIPGEVSFYMELVKRMLRDHADEAPLAAHVKDCNDAAQNGGEHERAYAGRIR